MVILLVVMLRPVWLMSSTSFLSLLAVTHTDVGDMTSNRERGAGQSSIPNGYGYVSGGSLSIDKFPFSSDADATAAGDLT